MGLGRLVRLCVLLATLAPVWLGPAMGTVIAALGGSVEHVCACGMKRGTCGCPACVRADAERAAQAREVAVRATTCDTHGVAPAPPLPSCIPLSDATRVLVAASRRLATPREPPSPPVPPLPPPPVPPPRAA